MALLHLHLSQKCVQRLAVRAFLRRAHGGLQLRFHGFPFGLDGAFVGRDALALFSQLDIHPRLHDEPGQYAGCDSREHGQSNRQCCFHRAMLTAPSQGKLAAEGKQTPVNLWEWSR